jgi:2-phospho-L-lactate guanylyltransferase
VSVFALVPVKPFESALGRLSGVLDSHERRVLQAAMLADVLSACATARHLEATLVITNDPEARALAASHGAHAVTDHDPPDGMNAAVARGASEAVRCGADAVLVLTADLALAQGEDLDAVITSAPAGRGVVIAPSLEGTGTNAMLLAPPEVIVPALGVGSLLRHLDRAALAKAPALLVHRPRLALDVDTPDDLAELCRRPGSSRGGAACRRLGITERLDAVGVH